MKRKHRHELKQNELLVWSEKVLDWYYENQRNLAMGVMIVAAAAIVIGGIRYYQGNRQAQAQSSLTEALEIFHGQLSQSSVVQGSTGQTFTDAEERDRKALAALEKVLEQYGGLEQGRQARYFAGICRTKLGEYSEAENLLSEVSSGTRDLLHYLASQALAAAKSLNGDHEAASDIYRLLMEDPGNPLPKDHLLYRLALIQERNGNIEEARRSFQQLLEEYPNSMFRGEVVEREEILAMELKS